MMAVTDLAEVSTGLRPRSRADYEDFLYREAALLDEWRLEEWLSLFTPDSG